MRKIVFFINTYVLLKSAEGKASSSSEKKTEKFPANYFFNIRNFVVWELVLTPVT